MPIKTAIRRSAYTVLQRLHAVPNSWSVGNAFKVMEFRTLVEGANLRRDHAVLDLGCGKGIQTQLLARRCGKVTGLDVGEKAIAEARRLLAHCPDSGRIGFLCVPLEDAGLPAASLDRVFSFSVLEHIPNLDRVLVEIARILKPGGELHISVDALANIGRELVEKHRKDHYVVQYFTPQTLQAKLEAAGMEVMEVYPIFTSGLAREQFELRIRSGGPRWLAGKILLYKRLESEEGRKESEKGVMLIARARRPSVTARQESGLKRQPA